MSLAFSIETGSAGPGRLAYAAGLCGLAGALVTGWYLSGKAGPAMLVAIPSLCLVLMWLSWRLSSGARTHGRLCVDDEGHASWCAPRLALPAPAQPCRWYAGSRLVWLRLQLPAGLPGREPELLIARDAVADDDWRRLQAWIRWRERGGGKT